MSRNQQLVCLVGLRCAGKTTVGAALAKGLGWPFSDLDQELVQAWNGGVGPPITSAGELLSTQGEAAFRELEERVLAQLLERGGPRVIATGGGCVESPASRGLLGGVRTLWLDAPVDVLAARLRRDGTVRPSLTGGDPAEELGLLAERRGAYYAQVSELTLDAARSPDELTQELLAHLAGGD